MGNHADLEKKNAQQQKPVQAKEGGQSMNPPSFSLEATPMQMKGGFWDTIQSGIDWVGDQLGLGDSAEKNPKEAAAPAQQPVAQAPVAAAPQAQAPAADGTKTLSAPTGSFEVTDPKAYLRNDPPDFAPSEPKSLIPQGSRVTVHELIEKEGKKYAYVIQEMGEGEMGPPMPWGWTSFGNIKVAGTKGASGATAEGLTDFALTKKQAQVSKDKEMVDYEGTDLTTLMLKKAGYDPASNWWGDFTDISLFGQTAGNLHSAFANLLKNGESKTVDKVTASDDYKEWVKATSAKNPDSAATVGKFLGLKNGYSTLRSEKESSQSMHIFGLAIDFNYTQNPWISDDGGKKTDDKGVRNTKTGYMQNALDRAGSLLGKTLDYQHVNADHFNYDMASTYDNFASIDKGFEQYFALGDSTKDADLKALLDKSTVDPWKGKTTEEARKIIEQDLKDMSALWSRKGKEEMIRKNGIMDLDRRLVLSMGEVGLDWGGKYGDMMHFDMRNAGVGKKIQAAKRDAEVVTKKKDLKAAEAK